jgi:hypothetical protein
VVVLGISIPITAARRTVAETIPSIGLIMPVFGLSRREMKRLIRKLSLLRGGSWSLETNFCRPAFRGGDYSDYQDNDIGFRVVIGGKK